MNAVKKFLLDENGPTAVEYAVMLALIIVVCLSAIGLIGTNLNTTYDQIINAQIESAKSGGTAPAPSP